jgi:hypothetical protein
MDYGLLHIRSNLWIWTGFIMGASLGVAIVVCIKGRQTIMKALIGLAKLSALTKARGYLPLWLIFLIFIGGGIGNTLIYHWMIPNFPFYIFIILFIVWPFLLGLINSRGVAETGFSVPAPPIDRSAILWGGYQGIDAWFMFPVGYYGGTLSASFVDTMKQAYLTETDPMDYFKGRLILLPFAYLGSLFWVSIFWNLAPIPSEAYPATVYGWSGTLQNQMMMATQAKNVYKLELIIIGLATVLIIEALNAIVHIPFYHTLGLLQGFAAALPNTITLVIGFLIGKYIIARFYGTEAWAKDRSLIVAGLIVGAGLIMGIVIAIALLAKAIWPIIF